MSNSFGRIFRVTSFGESHCKGVGCIVDGVPPRMKLTEADIQPQLTRRRPGQIDNMDTGRKEKDIVTILSGTEFGVTLGTPIAMIVWNKDHRPGDYTKFKDVPRPSHADFTYQMKYGVRASSGGGRASARETIGRVASGAIAEKFLKEKYGTQIVAWVSKVGPIRAPKSLETADPPITRSQVDQYIARCPHPETAAKMKDLILETKSQDDSLGGIVTCVITGVPTGFGEPSFEKLEAKLAHAMLSMPATKGFEIGSGFAGTDFRGSQHNDMFVKKGDRIGTKTNRSGGIQGGISNGEPIIIRIAFKPPATVSLPQNTVDFNGEDTILEAKGRHDPCVLRRALPIVESMAALVLADAALLQEARTQSSIQYKMFSQIRPEDAKWGEQQAEGSQSKL